ncbi:MAG: glycosyltransferase [Nanoarchaeota archaeon]
MIDVVIASYKEPKATLMAVNAFLKQKFKGNYMITVVDPFPEVEEFLKKNIKSKKYRFFLDPGEGKNYALSLIFQEYASGNKNDFFILSDGDVYVSENAVEELLKPFSDPKVGFVTGKPTSVDPRQKKYGYWSHLLFDGVDKVRKKLSKKRQFFQGTGYLSAIRKGIIVECPNGTADDVMIPYLIWKKGYDVVYTGKAKVYVKNPSNWRDWKNQKVRNIKGHENIKNVAPDMPRTKSFFNEVKEGSFFALFYPRNVREFYWTIQLYLARLYVYYRAFKEIRQKKVYKDGWREVEIKSTRPLD